MCVSAILVIGDRIPCTGTTGEFACSEARGATSSITCVEILGQSVLDRTVARLRNAGIRTISIVAGRDHTFFPSTRSVEITVADRLFERWSAAQRTVREHGSEGIETVFVIGLGAYMEFNVADILEFHRTQGMALTQLEDSQGPLDFWIVDSSWFTTAATDCTLPFRYGEFPGLPIPCPMSGYVNRLADARDLRRLVLDAFLSRCEIRPGGREVRPGIWVDDGARLHKFTRLVAPIYLGRSVKVEPSAVITRFSNLERHCQVGGGTVVDGSSVLPHTVLGGGLDVSHAVVDGNIFIDLGRNVAVQIDDRNLIRRTAPRKWRAPAQPHRGKDSFELDYLKHLSRAAGRASEVLFKG